jgi:hypothetical protein
MNNDMKNLPLEAELVSIKATTEEAQRVRTSLLGKTTIIKRAINANEFRLPQGPIRIGNRYFV